MAALSHLFANSQQDADIGQTIVTILIAKTFFILGILIALAGLILLFIRASRQQKTPRF